MKLYELTEEFEHALAFLSDSEMETEVIEDTLESLQLGIRDKALGVCAHIKNLESEASQIHSAEMRLNTRRKRLLKQASGYRNYLLHHLKKAEIMEAKNAEHVIKIQAPRDTVIIDDMNKLPSEYVRITETPDKTTLMKTFKEGGEVPGAHLGKGDPILKLS